LGENVILPVSELNRLRRELARQMETQCSQSQHWVLHAGSQSAEATISAPIHLSGDSVTLIVLVRDLGQLDAALRCGVTTLYAEFEEVARYRDALRMVRQPNSQAQLWIAPPRITKPGEQAQLQQLLDCDADGYLARNYDQLELFAGRRCIGDYSLNIANPLSAAYFRERFGLERVTVSYDLNAVQLETLVRAAPPAWFEVTIHQHMPLFHMEHCVFCAFLSPGKDFTDCGRQCEKHEVRLRDRVGAEHLLKADTGCRNTVFNAVTQTGAEAVPRLLALGVRAFRVEFLDENPAQARRTIGCYQQLLAGKLDGATLWRELKLLNHLGITRGPD